MNWYETVTEEQEKWLDLIRRHLIENLLMEKEDVDYLPIFTREGVSWGKLNKVFDGGLETIIHEINATITACPGAPGSTRKTGYMICINNDFDLAWKLM